MRLMIVLFLSVVVPGLALADVAFAEDSGTFNEYVLAAVAKVYKERKGGGYDMSKALTRDLQYGGECCVAAVPHPKPPEDQATMCVAAVHEVIVEAINAYVEKTGDKSAITKLPIDFWGKSLKLNIRPYLYMYSGVDSTGTASALKRFEIGEEVPFSQLKPGGFVNLNRSTGSGHAVVFISFIDKDGTPLQSYGDGVKGFKYFSAQGKGKPDAGFAYRWAYFGNYCPPFDATKPRDCGVIRSDKQKYLNSGYMYGPSKWPNIATVQSKIKQSLVEQALKSAPGLYKDTSPNKADMLKQLFDEIENELPSAVNAKFSGITTD